MKHLRFIGFNSIVENLPNSEEEEEEIACMIKANSLLYPWKVKVTFSYSMMISVAWVEWDGVELIRSVRKVFVGGKCLASGKR